VPLYVSLARVPSTIATYGGIVRLTPAAQWISYKDGSRDTQLLLTLSLLGQRQLFEDQLDTP
jgi:hypothetical protein